MRFAPNAFSALAIVAALVLAGCGGDDEGSTTTAGAKTSAARRAPADQGGESQGAKPQGQEGEFQAPADGTKTSKSRTQSAHRPAEPAPTSAGSLPNEGSKATAPGVPLAKGGDNSVQTYGVEGPSTERIEASRIAKAYLDARAAGRYAEACSYMAESIEAQLVQLGGRRRGQAPVDCTAVMRALTEGLSKSALRTAADIEVLSMRIDGSQAFLLYTDGEGTPSTMPMQREGADWKVAALAGSALVL